MRIGNGNGMVSRLLGSSCFLLAGGKLLVVVETGGHLSFFVLEFLGIDFSGAQY